jgi:hypothetical protein
MILDFITLKNEIFASIYSQRSERFKHAYLTFAEIITQKKSLSEEEQKAANQIQSAIAKLSKMSEFHLFDDFQLVKKQIKIKISEVVKRQIKSPEYVEYDTWLRGLGISDKWYHILLKTTAMIQLSVGCSNACRRCNEWALPGPRKHFSFQAAKKLVKDMSHVGGSMFSLYGASDPLDWKHNKSDISDLLSYMKVYGCDSGFGLLTKIPRGTEKIAEKLLVQDADVAVSITSKNKLKVSTIEKKVGKTFAAQHDVEELEIPSGMDEDFTSIKSSITDYYGTEITPEGAALVIPAFTSALHPTGQRRIPVTSGTSYFLKKRIGRDALSVEYFKPLNVLDSDGKKYTLKRLLDVQVENILLDGGDELITPPGMINIKEYFRTFEKEAVNQRKNLMPSAIKGLRKKVFPKGYESIGDKQDYIKLFKKQARCFFDSCSMERIIPYKIAAFSFFLSSISDYLETHPAEKEIILFLRRKDQLLYKESIKNIDSELRQSVSGLFHIFQSLQFRLFGNHHDEMIREFIDNNPSRYDPETDRFVMKTTG